MTWGEVKKAVQQKLDLTDAADLNEYLPGLVHAANEGMAMLATAGKPIRRTIVMETEEKEVELALLTPDLYRLEEVRRLEGEEEKPTLDYRLTGTLLQLPAAGGYRLVYSVYEEPVTEQTDDGHSFALDAEAAALLPLYLASQIYKHENVQLAVLWRNEFEAGRELLQLKNRQTAVQPGMAEFVAERWF